MENSAKAAPFFPFSKREVCFFLAVLTAFFVWDFVSISLANWNFSRQEFRFPLPVRIVYALIIAEALVVGTILAQTTIVAIWAMLAAGSTLLRVLLATMVMARCPSRKRNASAST